MLPWQPDYPCQTDIPLPRWTAKPKPPTHTYRMGAWIRQREEDQRQYYKTRERIRKERKRRPSSGNGEPKPTTT